FAYRRGRVPPEFPDAGHPTVVKDFGKGMKAYWFPETELLVMTPGKPEPMFMGLWSPETKVAVNHLNGYRVPPSLSGIEVRISFCEYTPFLCPDLKAQVKNTVTYIQSNNRQDSLPYEAKDSKVDGLPAKLISLEVQGPDGILVGDVLLVKRGNVYVEIVTNYHKTRPAAYAKRVKQLLSTAHFLTKQQIDALPASARSK
ncbi:MAG: hypothetical protein ACAH95_12350, partial [Fimbriimonas sp.]